MNGATAFNKQAIAKFVNNLEPFLKIDPARIYNIDETGISTVAKLPKFLGKCSKRIEV